MLGQHDGGRANVEALCGLDATASFDCIHGLGEIQEAIQDYGISKVGTTNVVLGQGCSFQLQAGMLPDRQIAWAELAMHSTTQDCWIILGSQGSGSVQLNPLQMSEVQKHNIAADCWVAVHGYVMDITG